MFNIIRSIWREKRKIVKSMFTLFTIISIFVEEKNRRNVVYCLRRVAYHQRIGVWFFISML